MSISIHSTALVDVRARIDSTARVGAFCVIGPDVVIGAGTELGPHCVIDGHTTLGCDNRIAAFVSLGAPPQDKKYAGEPTRLVIGDRNTVREFCTLNTGTAHDAGVTTVGNDNWIMAYVHIAHDCVVGNHTVLANNATLAGHVLVGDHAIIGGLTGIHQFTHVSTQDITNFASHISQDVPPFMMVDGNPLSVRGLNLEGLRRRGFSPERIAAVKQMHRLLYRQGLTLEAVRIVFAELPAQHPEAADDIALLLAFLAGSMRGIAR